MLRDYLVHSDPELIAGYGIKGTPIMEMVQSRKVLYNFRLQRAKKEKRLIVKKTLFSAFSYAQSRISLVVLWFCSFTAKSYFADFVYVCMEKKVGGLCLFVCKIYI